MRGVGSAQGAERAGLRLEQYAEFGGEVKGAKLGGGGLREVRVSKSKNRPSTMNLCLQKHFQCIRYLESSNSKGSNALRG